MEPLQDSFTIGTASTGGALKIYLSKNNRQEEIKQAILDYNIVIKGVKLKQELNKNPLG